MPVTPTPAVAVAVAAAMSFVAVYVGVVVCCPLLMLLLSTHPRQDIACDALLGAEVAEVRHLCPTLRFRLSEFVEFPRGDDELAETDEAADDGGDGGEYGEDGELRDFEKPVGVALDVQSDVQRHTRPKDRAEVVCLGVGGVGGGKDGVAELCRDEERHIALVALTRCVFIHGGSHAEGQERRARAGKDSAGWCSEVGGREVVLAVTAEARGDHRLPRVQCRLFNAEVETRCVG
mmetsp:Transcript_58806/g.138505  ORF Transcript_58806/g.138505 Transcript_58806/m.138505 type:complete len:234 (-) Transcript_58806:479-1180(-)